MPANDQSLKILWQNLPSEKFSMTEDQLLKKAQDFKSKHRRRELLEYAAFPVLLVLIAYALSLRAGWEDWVAAGLAVFGAFVTIRNFVKFSKVKLDMPTASGETTRLFLLRELTRQRDAAASAWKWYILPLVPFFMFVFAFRWAQEGATLTEITNMRISLLLTTIIAVIVLGLTILWQFLIAARYQRQLDLLDRCEK